jgi:superfamily II DNA/RNA helicase
MNNTEKNESPGFEETGASPFFAARLAEKNIRKATAIQQKVIPRLLAGGTILFRSATGTGKTFAYLIPVLQRLAADIDNEDGGSRGQGPRALICAPTYELCSQIKAEIDFLGPCPSALLIGSGSLNRQIETLKKTKPLIAAGNPGRLLVLAKAGKLKLNALRFLVLDEADRLIAEESREETGELLRLIEKNLRGDLTAAACSATMNAKHAELLPPLFAGAEFIESDEQEILREQIEHWAIFSDGRKKIQTLRSLLAALGTKKALVFAERGDQAGRIAARLGHHHFPAAALSGDMDKKSRKEAIDSFRGGKAKALIASDLAARGLDIPGLSHVIALNVPESGEAYIHRAGRTGRAGRRGIMISIGDETEMRRLALLEKKLGIIVRPKELYGGKIFAPDQVLGTPVKSQTKR